MRSSSMNAMEQYLSLPPVTAAAADCANLRYSAVSILILRWRLTTVGPVMGLSLGCFHRMGLVGFNDHLDQLVSHDVFFGEVDKVDRIYIGKNTLRLLETAFLTA